MTIRIVVADDHRIVREGLLHMLGNEEDMVVVGQAENGERAVQISRDLAPDAVIMDVSMPVMNGMEATRIITGASGRVKVIALSVHADRYHVDEMIQAGASGYVLKDCAFKELISAIRAVCSGRTYLSPEITGIVVAEYLSNLSNGNSRPSSAALTRREREVLKLIAEGMRTKEIGARLEVSVKTVETHRRQMMRKLGMYNIADLTKYAIREGITCL